MATESLLELDSARATVLASASALPAETVTLSVDLLGRVLGGDVIATGPVPAFDSSAMDGFAVRSHDLERAAPRSPVLLSVVGESRAGAPATGELATSQAIAISTGAMIPRGADTVVPVEHTSTTDGEVAFLAPAPAGQWLRRAGEDISVGAAVLARGARIGAAELGVLASLGRSQISCVRRPSVSVLVTGDELLGADQQMTPGGVRDSSSLTIPALVRIAGGEVLHAGCLPDEPEATRAGIAAAIERTDVAIICGGVSVGAHDHVRGALEALGARKLFWGIALKPGRPTWFGTSGQTLIFGLPGNPVSAMVTFALLVAPALGTMQGIPDIDRRTTAVLDSDYTKERGRAHAVRCRLSAKQDGMHAMPTGAQGSHILTSMLGAEALAIIPTESSGFRAGERVVIEPLGPRA